MGLAAGLGEQFAAAVRGRSVAELEARLSAAEASGLPEFRGVAGLMRPDGAAVRAGVAGPWSNGQVEGQVNRLKLVKRAAYGRVRPAQGPRPEHRVGGRPAEIGISGQVAPTAPRVRESLD